MKKLLYSLLAVSIIFDACSIEEDEVVTPVAPSIVGTWTPTSLSGTSSMSATVLGEIVDEFDTTFTMTPTHAEWEFSDMQFTADGQMISDEDTSSYSHSGNVLTVTDDEGTETHSCTVTSTSLTVIISDTETYTEDWGGLEATITQTTDMTLNCTRQ